MKNDLDEVIWVRRISEGKHLCANCKHGVMLGNDIGGTTIDENWCVNAYGEEWETEDNGGGYWVTGCKSYEPINTNVLYKTWMASDKWAKIRKKIIADVGYQCQRCGSAINLCVHHITYEHLCLEDKFTDDVVVLCKPCHEAVHRVAV